MYLHEFTEKYSQRYLYNSFWREWKVCCLFYCCLIVIKPSVPPSSSLSNLHFSFPPKSKK